MKNRKKRIISLLLITTITALLISSLTISVSAESLPARIDSNHYCEFFSPKTINVYTSPNCKTRGTEQPYKKYNAYIEYGDICYIYNFDWWSGNIQVSYPTPSGRRIGYIKRAELISGQCQGFDPWGPSKNITTYTTCKGSKYGTIYWGDEYVEYGVGSQGYYQIIYPAENGKRACKLAWVKW